MDIFVDKKLEEWNLSCLHAIFEGKVFFYIFLQCIWLTYALYINIVNSSGSFSKSVNIKQSRVRISPPEFPAKKSKICLSHMSFINTKCFLTSSTNIMRPENFLRDFIFIAVSSGEKFANIHISR
jgi:hypothetical protein